MILAIEINYSNLSSPSKVNHDKDDNRLISVGYKKIELLNSNSKLQFHKDPSDIRKIFGFYPQESWGFWSKGRRSLITIKCSSLSHRPFDLLLDAHPFYAAFSHSVIKLKSSLGHQAKVKITGDGPIIVTLKKPLFSRRNRLIVGDALRIKSRYNVSKKDLKDGLSIIIINHESPEITFFAAVAAVSSNIKIPFEIIIIQNASSSNKRQLPTSPDFPLRIVSLADHIKFGPANNFGSHFARGKYLLFLNSDAFLDEGAVNVMMSTFRKKSDCCIVGSILRFPDGIMQEAGATLQSDARPIRHGRNDMNFKTCKLPRYQSVDYVSGACLMIRKSDFLKMGGFDEKYSPAYYEDTDLCMRTLLYGQKVYLASRANCYHIENATTSTIENGAWATRTAEAHRQIFLKDWGGYLASRDPEDLPWHLKT